MRRWAHQRRGASVVLLPLLLGGSLPGCGGDRRPALPEAERQTAILTARSQGLALLQQDRLEEAEVQFRLVVDLAPDEADGYANLALVHLRRGEFDAALARIEEALRKSPAEPSLRLILARIHQEAGRRDQAAQELDAAMAADPTHLETLWAGARLQLSAEREDPAVPPGEASARAAARGRAAELLERVLQRAPGNLAARTELAGILIRGGELDRAAGELEEILSLAPDLPREAAAAWDRAVSNLQGGEQEAASRAFERFAKGFATTGAYQADLESLAGPPGEASGFPFLAFSHELSLQVPDPEAVLAALSYADGTEFSGLGELLASAGGERGAVEGGPAFARTADMDGDSDQDLFAWTGTEARLLRNDLGRFVDVTPESLRSTDAVFAAAWGDADNDGRFDLYVVREGANQLFRAREPGGFEESGASAGVADPGSGIAAVWADLDQDGDLDLYVANRGPDRVYRNDLDGGFSAPADFLGLAGSAQPSQALAFADLDGDVDVDLLVARGDSGVVLYRNERQAGFREASGVAGLAGAGPATIVRVGDYENDGMPDLLLAGPASEDGLPLRLYRNTEDGLFRLDQRSVAAFGAAGLRGGPAAPPLLDAAFLDFDNDGHLDLVTAARSPRASGPAASDRTAGAGGGEGAIGHLFLFRNRGDGTFEDATEKLGEDRSGSRIEVFDYNEDGDLDLLVGIGTAGLRLLRNDGGNVNHHLQVRLVGRGAGSGKVNRFGIGSTIELRAAELFQSRYVTRQVTHFGLGRHLKADVVRVVWTNGVPQDLYFPGTDQDLIESQTLKGSCAFVYGWDGERYVFVTDAMWKSALGMPLGIMTRPGADAPRAESRIYAPPRASQEYVRIPGELLRPSGGRYRLQLTEELWEVAYVDEVKLLAIEHPHDIEVYVDERFVPPAPPRLRLFALRAAERRPPRAAVDGLGHDLLTELRARDSVYAGQLLPGPYQGIVRPHELVLDLGSEAAEAERPLLFLQGWIFPTDASINVAVGQSSAVEVKPPVLEVPDGRGGWKTAVPDLSFPAGKDKTVIVELAGLLAPGDPRVRIRTNMQIYWDHAFVVDEPVAALDLSGPPVAAAPRIRLHREAGRSASATTSARPEASSPTSPLRGTLLAPAGVDLHYRGFSREYRKGGRRGPHWFDYEEVSTEPRWLPIPGRYTRYGEVGELLGEADDRYVILAPGDEMTLEFDPAASGLSAEPPAGWTRTFLLYTDGWIKDADLNTATGQTVEPLPFQAQSAYPPPPGEAFPDDPAHRAWRERYNTREVAQRR